MIMRKSVVILPNNLGDVIMTLPVLQGLKTRDRDRVIIFFVEEGYEGGLLNSPFCDHVFRFRRKEIKKYLLEPRWHHGLTLLRDTIHTFRGDDSSEIDIVNLSQHDYTSYLTTLLKGDRASGRRFLPEGNHALPDAWSQYLYTIPFARRCNSMHATDVYCRIAGVHAGADEKRIILSSEECDRAAQFLETSGISLSGEKIVVLQPGAAFASKRWPPERFIALGKMLVNAGFRIVVTGAPAEHECAIGIAREIDSRVVVVAGHCSFRETIALLHHARCVVTGDTAIMHAAAALCRKVVALFGPTSPVETGPYGNGHRVIGGTCPHRPCFRAVCDDHQCMRSITPEVVYRCVREETPVDAVKNVYTTRLESGGYFLEGAAGAYYDTAVAGLVRSVFDEQYTGKADVDEEDRNRTLTFCGMCTEMEAELQGFLQSRQSAFLHNYEKRRAAATQIGGIAAFWTALLNIRLNSVPLLDPLEGIKESKAVVGQTRRQIMKGFN